MRPLNNSRPGEEGVLFCLFHTTMVFVASARMGLPWYFVMVFYFILFFKGFFLGFSCVLSPVRGFLSSFEGAIIRSKKAFADHEFWWVIVPKKMESRKEMIRNLEKWRTHDLLVSVKKGGKSIRRSTLTLQIKINKWSYKTQCQC